MQLTGRTHCDRIVVFDGTARQIGKLLPIRISDVTAHTLFGVPVIEHVGPALVAARLSQRACSPRTCRRQRTTACFQSAIGSAACLTPAPGASTLAGLTWR